MSLEETLEKEKIALAKALAERVQSRSDNQIPGPHRLAGPKLRDLKSDVKKSTAFSKKVKGFSGDQASSILSDLKTLNI